MPKTKLPTTDQFILLIELSLAFLALLWVSAVVTIRVGLRRLSARPSRETPSVTVLVAARNEEASIDRTLEALIDQDYPAGRLEIVVIDDNSTDRTTEIVREAALRCSNLRLCSAPGFTGELAPKKNALLAGIKVSSGEIILTTDADCDPGRSWVKGMAGYFDVETVAAVGYSPLTGKLAGFDAFINGVISAGTIGLGYPTTAVGRNFAYRREAFERIGGFGSTIRSASGDDDLLLQRLADSGGKIVFATDPATFVPARGAEDFGGWLRMKRRHLSAGVHYSAGLVILFAALYLFHLGLIGAIIAAGMGAISWGMAAALWAGKALADFIALQKGAKVLHQRGWISSWLVAEIVSPLLVSIVTPLALTGKVKWKGRELRR